MSSRCVHAFAHRFNIQVGLGWECGDCGEYMGAYYSRLCSGPFCHGRPRYPKPCDEPAPAADVSCGGQGVDAMRDWPEWKKRAGAAMLAD
jgi:hypothetical protein